MGDFLSPLRNSRYKGVLYTALRFIQPYDFLNVQNISFFSQFFEIQLPTRVHEAMQMQVEAERKKRAAILESEGIREAEINVAEGKRQARILASGTN